MIRAVIFDLDGVIVDTEPIWFETYGKVCREYGFDFNQELDKLVKGRADGVVRLTATLGIPEKCGEFSEKVGRLYRELFDRKAKLMPGVLKLLRNLGKSYQLGLATSAYKDRLEFNFQKFPQIKRFFVATVSADEVKNGKPSPDTFLLVAKKLNLEPEECLVIEDAETGVTAAKAARMKVIGVEPSRVTPQNLSAADMVVNSLSEIRSKLL